MIDVTYQELPVWARPTETDELYVYYTPASIEVSDEQIADSITEIKTICTCGKKAIVNARIDGEGRVVTEGGQILIGGNDSYVAMCHSCWMQAIDKQEGKA